MSAAIQTDTEKNKTKSKHRMLGVFNRIKSVVTPKQQMLTTDAAPMDDSQISSNIIRLPDENLPSHQLSVPDLNVPVPAAFPMQMVRNNMNQLNQNATIIGTQQNLSFSNCDNLHIGSNIYPERRTSSRKNSYNGNNGNNEKRPKTKTVKEMENSNDPIDVPIMQITSRYMDKDWAMVFRDLGISDPEINQIKQQHINSTSVKEVIYQLLLIWERNDDEPTLGKLITALWKNEDFKCVEEIKMLYKQRRHQAQTRKTSDTPAMNTNAKNTVCNGESR